MKISLIVLLSVAAIISAKDDKDELGTVIGIDLGTTYSWYV